MKTSLTGFFLSLLFLLSSCKTKESCLTCPSPPTDTTSHNFTWQTFTFGGAGAAQFYDVAIINDTLAYAVGAIYLNDSTGHYDPFPYNLARWNGSSWSMERLSFLIKLLWPNSSGDTIGYAPAKSIFAFNENDIWIATGTVQHWNGTQWQQFQGAGAGGSIKMWGSSSNDMYFVGYSGLIIHYNGNSWTKIESGTTLPINDIYGAYNSTTKQWEILAVASDDANKKLLRIQGTSVSSVPDDSLSNSLYGVWFVPCEKYYVVGAGDRL